MWGPVNARLAPRGRILPNGVSLAGIELARPAHICYPWLASRHNRLTVENPAPAIMHADPSPELIALLARLRLARPDEVRRVRGRVVRLAHDLPRFESVWVDALLQRRILTPYQAAEINGGRGEALAVGPYVLCRHAGSSGYAERFLARHRESRVPVCLTVAPLLEKRSSELLGGLDALVQKGRAVDVPSLAVVNDIGEEPRRVWAASRDVPGMTVAEWMVRNGRFPPEAVLEIARQMLEALAVLDSVGLVHGDLRPADIVLSGSGKVILLQPGVRQVLHPDEMPSDAKLMPEAYDYLAPERIACGSPPNPRSEIYACGCLWWHMLTGRAPLRGGNSLVKIQAAQIGRIPDVRLLAPETPAPLAEAVTAAVQRDPRSRPQTISKMATILGPTTNYGNATLRHRLHGHDAGVAAWGVSARHTAAFRHSALGVFIAGGCLVAAAAIGWAVWRDSGRSLEDAVPPRLATAAAAGMESAAPTITDLVAPNGDPERQDAAPDRDITPPNPPGTGSPPDVFILPCDSPVALDAGSLRSGQTVRGEVDARPIVVIPSPGLTLARENIRFQNIDFVWDAPEEALARQATMIRVQASSTAFQGCSFQSARTDAIPTAIAWLWPPDEKTSQRALPSGTIAIRDCVFRSVAAGVSCHTRAALAIDVDNTLYLGRGPLLDFRQYPRIDEPIVIRLRDVTLRESGPLMTCYWDVGEMPGAISVVADRCAFVPAGTTALMTFASKQTPRPVLPKIRWSGQGSLLAPAAPMVHWQDEQGRLHPLDDSAMSIAGLVRSEVEFAGPVGSDAGSSRVVRWQVPLQSSAAPGADPSRLAKSRD